MRDARRVVIAVAIVLILPFPFKAYSQETKQEAKPDSAAATIEETKLAPAAEGKSESMGTEHDHTMGVENRFVALIGADGIQHIILTGGEYYFDPNYIVVKVNVPVELKVRKAPGYIPHDIVVKAPESGIDFQVNLGKDWQVITFTPTKIGKYEMVCDKKLLWFKSHQDRGMVGYIDVVP